jgi:hypothetical protein
VRQGQGRAAMINNQRVGCRCKHGHGIGQVLLGLGLRSHRMSMDFRNSSMVVSSRPVLGSVSVAGRRRGNRVEILAGPFLVGQSVVQAFALAPRRFVKIL